MKRIAKTANCDPQKLTFHRLHLGNTFELGRIRTPNIYQFYELSS